MCTADMNSSKLLCWIKMSFKIERCVWGLYSQVLTLLLLAQLWLSSLFGKKLSSLSVSEMRNNKINIKAVTFRRGIWDCSEWREKKLSTGGADVGLQDLQMKWPVKVGLMYCLQDLQLRWPFKVIWREISMLTGFNISAGTKLQVLLIAVRQCHITPAEQLPTAMMLHYCTFPVRPSVNCNRWTNLSCDCNERFCCCIATAAQIALTPHWDWWDLRDKAAISTSITAGYRTPTHPINPSFIPDAPFAPILLTHWRTLRSATLWQRLRCHLLLFCHRKRLERLLLCLVHLATLYHPTGMVIWWLTVQ